MIFSSLSFIFFFLPFVFLMYLCVPQKYKKIYLFILSVFFYAWGEPIYIFGLIFLIFMNYKWAMSMDSKRSIRRKNYLIWILGFNIFIFIYFKYYNLILQTIFNIFDLSLTYEVFEVPLGISFFMFSVIGYQIDVYKQKYNAEKNFIDFSLFVSFFPKLTMGPIMSYDSWKQGDMKMSIEKLNKGAIRFIIGLAQKVILAEEMGKLFQMLMLQELNFVNAWLMTLAFAFQLYFDFNGYTHMALGIAGMFGFHLPENFDYPYLSTSISMFWRRWHITLGRWFRDYIYIPLGGNRVSKLKWIRNTMLVWMVTGLWHGAQWTFVLWGVYHGFLIIFEKMLFKEYLKKLPKSINVLLTFLLVNIGWVFFYSTDFMQAFQILCAMFTFQSFSLGQFLYYIREYGMTILICVVAATPLAKNVNRKINEYQYRPLFEISVMFIVFLITIAFLLGSTYQSFMYSAF